MKRLLLLAWLASGVFPALALGAGEAPQVLPVWPGKTIGDHGKVSPERVRTFPDAPTNDAKWISDVSRPTISVFRPAAGKNARVAVVVCPGGGYWNLAWDKEGEEVAEWLRGRGITGVVLKYRVPRRPGEPEPLPAPGPLLDAQRAVRLVRSKAREWDIDPGRIGIMGFSAGGHLALMTAISFEKPAYEAVDEVDRESPRPDFAVVAYPGYILKQRGSGVLADYIKIPRGTGPIFLVHASDDDEPGAQPEQSLALYATLRGAGVPVELHLFQDGGHGFGVRASRGAASRWPAQCEEWLRHRGILPANSNGISSPSARPDQPLTGQIDTARAPLQARESVHAHQGAQARHNRPPRKVIVGTTMTRWYSDYPGLDGRVNEMRALIDEMAAESRVRLGRSLDLALFSEYAVTAGKSGTAAEVAVPLDGKILDALGAKAREHHAYVVFGGVFRDLRSPGDLANAAVVIDREGRRVGQYVKVHPVLDTTGHDGNIVLEGGVKPGDTYNVFDLDFGRVGIQICYDVEYPEGWRRLAEQGADLVLYPTQSPQLTRPGMYAATLEYWIVSSTFRNNASVFEPGTGLTAARISEPKRTLVHELDLSYLILPWTSRLRNGAAFREAFGERVGYRYSESEDRGVFWSNDSNRTIGDMARSLDLLESTTEQQARARAAQDQLRGGPPR